METIFVSKVSLCTFAILMKDKILEISAELFLNLGFKSVTMDEIANKLGVSKKTIYKYFKNKTSLVDCVTKHLFRKICFGIDLIHQQQKNPIIELFEIKQFVMKNLKNEKSSPQYQLQKYYPKIFTWLKKEQFNIMHNSILENLKTGIDNGYYRENTDIDFTARIYFHGLNGIRDADMFPYENYPMKSLMNSYLEYHIRGIATEKGLLELKKQLTEK